MWPDLPQIFDTSDCIASSGKDFLQIFDVVVLFLRYDHVIYIVFQTDVKHIVRDDSHATLIGGLSVLETEHHNCVMEIAHGSQEGSLSTYGGSILI